MMRCKVHVTHVETVRQGDDDAKVQEIVHFAAVARDDGYKGDGLDEDNTFAKWSPSADFHITIANPALWDKFSGGQRFYVDFTEAPAYQPRKPE